MRLFLSSQSLGNYPDVFVKLVGKNKRVAFSENAKDDWPQTDRDAEFKEHKDLFESIGLMVEELDLRKFFGRPNKLEEFLKDFGAVWMSGGNTFLLSRAFRYSGLDSLLSCRLKENTLAYGGSSAGTIMMTPGLHGVERGDRPKITPRGYKPEIVWEGLGVVPYYIVPHYKSGWFDEESQMMADYYDRRKLKYYTLQDGQVIVIDGDNQEILK